MARRSLLARMGGAPDEPETHTQIGASPTTPAIPPPPIVPRPTPGLVVQTDGRSIVIQWSPDPISSTVPAGPTSDAQAPRTTVSHPTPPDRATRATTHSSNPPLSIASAQHQSLTLPANFLPPPRDGIEVEHRRRVFWLIVTVRICSDDELLAHFRGYLLFAPL